jgi:hypothetical protein
MLVFYFSVQNMIVYLIYILLCILNTFMYITQFKPSSNADCRPGTQSESCDRSGSEVFLEYF